MRQIYVIRHGETDWNHNHLFQGQTDMPLNENGYLQASRLTEKLKDILPFDRIVSSDLSRAVETAAILNKGYTTPILTDPGLREVDFGEWEGLTADAIEQRWPGELHKWFSTGLLHAPGGEAFEVFYDRVWRCFQNWANKKDYQTMAMISHGGSCRVLMCAILEKPIREMSGYILANTEALIVRVDDNDKYSVVSDQDS